jgi:hypothetical protein
MPSSSLKAIRNFLICIKAVLADKETFPLASGAGPEGLSEPHRKSAIYIIKSIR